VHAQLAAIGHAIVGDTLYAPPSDATRLMLHACELRLPHPTDGRTLVIVSRLPF
jgi:tRNA pseudouridine32 synthase / 23S rRNA pseudouridine746 synthase